MKPAPFVHHSPTTVDEAVALLADVATGENRVLAGGQSLVPAMALRLAQPEHIIDINNVAGLERFSSDETTLSIGATVRHAGFHGLVVEGPLGQLLSAVVRHIAHYPIRMRGTFCGSLANADPASEWCLVAATLGAEIHTRSVKEDRCISIDKYFQGVMTTALLPDELLVEARMPLLATDTRFGFYEVSRRAGDFAIGMALVTYRVEEGLIADPCVGIGGIEGSPGRIAEAEEALMGRSPSDKCFRKAAECVASVVDPIEDHQTPADYRRDLARTVVHRALERAAA